MQQEQLDLMPEAEPVPAEMCGARWLETGNPWEVDREQN